MLKILESLILKGFQGFKSFEYKTCPFCISQNTKRNVTRNGRQRYQCKICLKRFDGGHRLNPDEL
ncbi:transposase-like zinc-binding domain-containing protein [Neisseria dentiae]|uniref:transposase-like zinc-binding domain-containing protein n=1 Tax=Neisseria dentiae TaxID=194197 RepID=UPI003CCC506A